MKRRFLTAKDAKWEISGAGARRSQGGQFLVDGLPPESSLSQPQSGVEPRAVQRFSLWLGVPSSVFRVPCQHGGALGS